MCPRPVVVLDVLQQDLEQMPFADHDDVVQAFSSNRADHPLGIRVLPRRAGRNDGLLDAQQPGLMRKSFSIDLVSVPNEIPGPSSSAHASSSWRAVHSAVGCSVTLKCTSRRRLWVRTTSTTRTRKVAVGTVKKSNALRSGAWFFKNVRHACDGGLRGRTMYFDTVACETVRPSFNSSPWILGAPHSGFARLICRIRSRRSLPIAGRPHRRRLFHAQ